MQKALSTFAFAMAVSTPAFAQLDISLGIRETGAGGGSFTAIGDSGGFSGAIEWVNLDGQVLQADGAWVTYTFDLANDTLTGFTGNGALDGDFGTIEHIRIRNGGSLTGNLSIWIDDVQNITDAGTTTIADFESAADGDEVVFQEPGFSGSTAGGIAAGDTSGVTSANAFNGQKSFRCDFSFIDDTATRWCRLTTFQTPNTPNPLIRFDQNSQVQITMRLLNCDPASVTTSASCPAGLHSLGGPVIGAQGAPGINQTIEFTADNVFGTTAALFIGPEVAPIPIAILSSVPGASLCINPVEFSIPFSGGGPQASVSLSVGASALLCGTAIQCQWFDLDTTGGGLDFGTSEVLQLVVGS